MSIPKTIFLDYINALDLTTKDKAAELVAPLPTRMHLRGCQVVQVIYNKDRSIRSLTLASEYDAVHDVVVDMELRGTRGFVTSVRFKEAA